MVIDLKKCEERPLRVHERFELGPRFAGHREIETVDPVEADFEVRPAGAARFRAVGGLRVGLTAYCVRCLEPFRAALAGRFDLTYVPESMRPELAPGEVEMDSDAVDVSYYRDEQLEVLPMLEEQVNLSLPMRFVCVEGCRGLCQHCGANRNRTDCGCQGPPLDPRLEVLKKLLS